MTKYICLFLRMVKTISVFQSKQFKKTTTLYSINVKNLKLMPHKLINKTILWFFKITNNKNADLI